MNILPINNINSQIKMRIFIVEKIKGLLFILFSIFSLISLITYNIQDPGIGTVGDYNEVSNAMGFLGAYFSSFMKVFFGYSSFFFPLFFLINGLSHIFRKNIRSVLINIVILYFKYLL